VADDASIVLRRLVMPVYLPVMAGTIGMALLIPVLPLYLTESGMSLGLASVVLAATGIGAFLGGLPAGSLIARFGTQRVLSISLIALAISTALLGATAAAIGLIALRLAAGAANIALRLSRQTFVTRRVADSMRGRAMSVIGGSFRFSLFVGPLIGGLLVDTVGFTATFAIAGLLTAFGLLPALLSRDRQLPPLDGRERPPRPVKTRSAIRAHWRLLATAGAVPMLVMTAREGRYVVLPLIGDDLGLSATGVGAVITVGTAADVLLFPVAGWTMDRYGRLAAMVPAFGLIALGLVMLGFATSTAAVVVSGAVIGIGNGMSSGTMLTLGSDIAPAEATGQFLAGMAVLQDLGRILGPLLVGVVGASMGLGAAAIALAIVLVAAIVWLVLVVGETSGRPATAPVAP
jgi:MFS family permease